MPIPAHTLLLAGGTTAESLDTAIAAIGAAREGGAGGSGYSYWKLNETSGTTITETPHGGTYNGTMAGTYTLNDATGPDGRPVCKFTDGRMVSGETSQARHMPNGSPTGLSAFALIKPTISTGTRHFVVNFGRSAPAYNWDANVNFVDGDINVLHYGSGGGRRAGGWTNNTAGLVVNSWNACVWTLETDSVDAVSHLYRNNNTDLSVDLGHTDTSATDTGGAIWIGDRADAAAAEFVGYIARVAIFKAELSSSEVQRLMTAADNEGWI